MGITLSENMGNVGKLITALVVPDVKTGSSGASSKADIHQMMQTSRLPLVLDDRHVSMLGPDPDQ